MKVKLNSPIMPPAKIPSPSRGENAKQSKQDKAKPPPKPNNFDESKLQMLDRVEITRDQKNGKLRKGMRGTILHVFTGDPEKAFFVEIIRPSIVETIGDKDVRPIKE